MAKLKRSDEKRILAEQLAEYILNFEADDFTFYCDDEERNDHIYMVAWAYAYGGQAAKEMLA